MRFQSKAVASLMFAYGLPTVSAFTTFTASTKVGTGVRSTFHKSTRSALYTVTDLKSETDTTVVDGKVEEKAWKIIKEESEDGNFTYASSNATVPELGTEIEKETITEPEKEAITEPTVEADIVEANGSIEAVKEEMKASEKDVVKVIKVEEPSVLDEFDLVIAVEEEASALVDEMALGMDEECEIDEEGNPTDELCDESKLSRAKAKLKGIIGKTLGLVRTGGDEDLTDSASDDDFKIIDFDDEEVPEGELLERGWEKRGNSNALRRNAEVWKFALSCVFKALKPRKLRKKGAPEDEIDAAKTEAATYIRNGLLRLGPSFVKLVSKRLGVR